MIAKPSITLKAAPVSRCTAAQEMVEALRVVQQIAARLDGAPKLRLDGAPKLRLDGAPKLRLDGAPKLRLDNGAQEKPAQTGNEGV